MLAAASSWSTLSAELSSSATAMHVVLDELPWTGPSALAMRTTVTGYLNWLTQTSAQCQQMAISLQQAAAAFQAVHAGVTPPPLVFANRTTQAHLIATNILGQNTPVIMALEAQYMAMWAQNIAAMTSYDTSSAAAAAQSPQFTPPTQSTNPATGTAPPGQGGTGMPNWLTSFLNGLTSNSGGDGTPAGYLGAFLDSNFINSIWSGDLLFGAPTGVLSAVAALGALTAMSGVTNGGMVGDTGVMTPFGPIRPRVSVPPPEVVQLEPTPAPVGGAAPVSGSMGSSYQLGRLSTPPSWATNAPEVRSQLPPVRPLESAEEENSTGLMGLPVMPAVPVTGGRRKSRRGSNPDDYEYGLPVGKVMPKTPAGG